MIAGVDPLDVLVGIEPGLAHAIGREEMARGRGGIGEGEGAALEVGDRLQRRSRRRDDARPIDRRLAVRLGIGGDRLGLGDLMRQHVAERSELARLELTGPHRLDLGVVARGDQHLHLAAELLADQLGDMVVDRHQLRRGIERLDPEPHGAAVRAIGGVRREGRRRQSGERRHGGNRR